MEPLSDVEKALARLTEVQQRHAGLADQIGRLKAQGVSTALYDQVLRTLENSLELAQAHARRLTEHLTPYRCYMMNGEHNRGVKSLDAADDAEVLIKAGLLLKERPEYPAIEIWAGKRLVARLARP